MLRYLTFDRARCTNRLSNRKDPHSCDPHYCSDLLIYILCLDISGFKNELSLVCGFVSGGPFLIARNPLLPIEVENQMKRDM